MSQRTRVHLPVFAVAAMVGLAACGGADTDATVEAEPAADVAMSTSSADMEPTNDLPNPYTSVENWAQLPAGQALGSASAVDIAPDGESIWVASRCGGNVGACVENSDVDPIMQFDAEGNMVRSFGAGMIAWPHGIAVDNEGNVWVADARGDENTPEESTYGHQVHKFSPEGEHLMALGAPGGERGSGYFWQPNDVYVMDDGTIFVAAGHCNDPEQCGATIYKFDGEGNLLMSWGEMGNGPTQMMQPHALAMDSQGRLFVGDRSNDRIHIFDQEGNLLDTWYQFARPSGVYIDGNDRIYVADSESGSVAPEHGAWERGIRIGSAQTGEVEYLIPDPNPGCTGTCVAEGVVVDNAGNVYGAEVEAPGALMRYEPAGM